MKFSIRDLFLVTVIVALAVVSGYSEVRCEEAGSKSSTLSVSMLLSDVDILVGDPVLYKLLFRNRSRSLIYLAKPPGQRFVHFLDYRRQPSKEWVQVAEISAATRGVAEGERTVAAEQAFAAYGQFFTDDERKALFTLPGDYEVRIRVKCLLGEFTTEPQTVHVRERPLAEVRAILEHAGDIRVFFNHCTFSEASEVDFRELRAKCNSGSVARSLKMFAGLKEYMETKTVAGEKRTSSDAFSILSKGLDEVRHDQLATAFIWNALQSKQWKDAEELLPQLAEETNWRDEFVRALQAAARRQLQKKPVP